MSFYSYMDVSMQLDAIEEIVNQALWYIYNPTLINDVDELRYALMSITEMITEINEILEKELMNNEGYTEPQESDTYH